MSNIPIRIVSVWAVLITSLVFSVASAGVKYPTAEHFAEDNKWKSHPSMKR